MGWLRRSTRARISGPSGDDVRAAHGPVRARRPHLERGARQRDHESGAPTRERRARRPAGYVRRRRSCARVRQGGSLVGRARDATCRAGRVRAIARGADLERAQADRARRRDREDARVGEHSRPRRWSLRGEDGRSSFCRKDGACAPADTVLTTPLAPARACSPWGRSSSRSCGMEARRARGSRAPLPLRPRPPSSRV